MKRYESSRLITKSLLNHHGTLFAANAASLFVEAGFAAAAREVGDPGRIICLKIHELTITRPIAEGELLRLDSLVCKAGVTSLMTYVWLGSAITGVQFGDGFITFVFIDKNGKKAPHGIVLDEADEWEKAVRLRAGLQK